MPVHVSLILSCFLFPHCGPGERSDEQLTSKITEEQAINCATEDARKVYGELNQYAASATLEHDGWHVEFVLKDKTLRGGGPRYVIDPNSGAIKKKTYEQ